MEKLGGSGRGAIWYGDESSVLAGVLAADDVVPVSVPRVAKIQHMGACRFPQCARAAGEYRLCVSHLRQFKAWLQECDRDVASVEKWVNETNELEHHAPSARWDGPHD